MSQHADAGQRCLVAHYESVGERHFLPEPLPPCIKCVCGEWVRPEDWEAHRAATTKEADNG